MASLEHRAHIDAVSAALRAHGFAVIETAVPPRAASAEVDSGR